MDKNSVYTNRELSWLQFNERVLEEGLDKNVPIYERLKFIAIFQSNLDEFFMVRVGSLCEQKLVKPKLKDSKTKLTSAEQIGLICKRVKKLNSVRDKAFSSVNKELSKHGIEQVFASSKLTDAEYEYLNLYFDKEIMPLISPQIIDKRQPFPFLKNREIYIGVHLASKSGKLSLGVIPAESHFNRIIFLPFDKKFKFMLAEDLILLFAHKVFNKHQVLEKTIFRITRSADIDVEQTMVHFDMDFREAMEELLKKRRRLSPVRLELSQNISGELQSYMAHNLDLAPEQVFVNASPLDLSYVYAIEDRIDNKPDLFYEPLTPQASASILEDKPMIAQIQNKDLLLHYPYESIKPFLRLLNEAAEDKNVLSVKITLYRVAKNSKVIDALVKAAENGKEVSVVVELRARFDEDNNIGWSKRLEEAGCNVMYGLPGYKVHSKLLLITRKIGNKIEYITQIGTGNYNEKTSKLYTDLSLMTANREIGADASAVFNSLFTGSPVESSTHLLVAPLCCKNRIIEMIDKEIAFAKQGEPARILLKMNSVTDKVLIDKLIEAQSAGVKIRMIVRGICCFKPQTHDSYEDIEIRSIVGRFLEHSRIYVFGTDERMAMYISSADFMTRNTERRVEVATPIYDKDLQMRIMDILNIMLKDNVKARIQNADGIYVRAQRAEGDEAVNAQEYLYKLAYENAAKPKEHSASKKPVAAKPVKNKKIKKDKKDNGIKNKIKRLFKR